MKQDMRNIIKGNAKAFKRRNFSDDIDNGSPKATRTDARQVCLNIIRWMSISESKLPSITNAQSREEPQPSKVELEMHHLPEPHQRCLYKNRQGC